MPGPETTEAERGLPAVPAVAQRRRVAVLLVALVLGLVLGLLTHFAFQRLSGRTRVLRGVTCLGVPLGGKSGPALTAAVEGLARGLGAQVAGVTVRGRPFVVKATSLGLELDVSATERALLAAGRDGGILGDLRFFLARLHSPFEVSARLRRDADLSEALLAQLERDALGEPASEGTVRYRGGLEVTLPREGWVVAREPALSLLEELFSVQRSAEAPPAPLPVRQVKPRLTPRDVDHARTEAETWLREPIVLTSADGERRLVFPVDALGAALSSRPVTEPAPRLELTFDRAALLAFVETVRKDVEVPPRDATYDVGPRHELTLVPSVIGQRLNDDKLVSLVEELARGTVRRGELPFLADVPPKLGTEELAGMGIKELVSRYTTYFPCCEARVTNIARMAELLDGRVVRPGEELSVNAVSGPRTTAGGFVAGPTLVEGEMEMTVGGGASQFATTLFNAVFEGGYELIQRQAHTYWFARYPEGHDATLGFPLPDLIFKNDGKAGLIIKAKVGKTSVTVSLYGDKEGRKVTRHVSRRFDVVQPKTEYIPDPSRLPGEPKVKQKGQPGWSLHVSRRVTFVDGTKKEERRRVVYNPRVHRLEVHPCEIPEGEEGHTGEECPEPELAPDAGPLP